MTDVHVIPSGDLREHEDSRQCWCNPKPDDEDHRVVIHNSMDRREHTIEKGKLQ